MSVTIEQIREGIAANAELKTQILTEFDSELPEYVKGKGFVVRSAEDDEKEFGKRLNPRVAEIYGNLEKDVLDSFGSFGLKKDSNTEKVYDLVKKAPGLISAKIQDLETKLAAALEGKGDDVTKAQIEAFKTQVEQLKNEKTELEKGYAAKELSYKAGQQFDKAFSKLTITVPASVAEKDKGDYIQAKQAQMKTLLMGKYSVAEKDGNIVFTDSDGNIQMNGTEIATAEHLLSTDFKYDFEAAKKGGSGSQGGEGGATVLAQTKEQLYAQLAKEGLTAGSNAWVARANELAGKNGIDLTK